MRTRACRQPVCLSFVNRGPIVNYPRLIATSWYLGQGSRKSRKQAQKLVLIDALDMHFVSVSVSHMGPEHASRDKKLPMVIFF